MGNSSIPFEQEPVELRHCKNGHSVESQQKNECHDVVGGKDFHYLTAFGGLLIITYHVPKLQANEKNVTVFHE